MDSEIIEPGDWIEVSATSAEDVQRHFADVRMCLGSACKILAVALGGREYENGGLCDSVCELEESTSRVARRKWIIPFESMRDQREVIRFGRFRGTLASGVALDFSFLVWVLAHTVKNKLSDARRQESLADYLGRRGRRDPRFARLFIRQLRKAFPVKAWSADQLEGDLTELQIWLGRQCAASVAAAVPYSVVEAAGGAGDQAEAKPKQPPARLLTPSMKENCERAMGLIQDGISTIEQIAGHLNLAKSTVARHIIPILKSEFGVRTQRGPSGGLFLPAK